MTRPACRCGCGKIPKSATAMYWPGHSQRGVLKHTDEELLTELRKWFADHGGKPPVNPNRGRYSQRFGSFAAACKLAGVDDRRIWTRERMVVAFLAHHDLYGHAPTNREWQRPVDGADRPPTTAVIREFGSWGAGLAAAGLAPKRKPPRNDGKCVYGHPKTNGSCVECHRQRRRREGQKARMLTPEVDRRAAEAIRMVRDGWSARAAAARVGIHKAGLDKRIRRNHPELVAMRRTVSALEDRVAAVLDVLAIEYTRQEPIETERSFCVLDFVIDGKLALEVNGTYWHADPRVFPLGPRYPAQVRIQESWPAKEAAIARAGLALVVVWEIDLEDDMRGTLTAALCDRRVGAT